MASSDLLKLSKELKSTELGRRFQRLINLSLKMKCVYQVKLFFITEGFHSEYSIGFSNMIYLYNMSYL